jgi:hypothetical protein
MQASRIASFAGSFAANPLTAGHKQPASVSRVLFTLSSLRVNQPPSETWTATVA